MQNAFMVIFCIIKHINILHEVEDHENHVRWICLRTVLNMGESQKHARMYMGILWLNRHYAAAALSCRNFIVLVLTQKVLRQYWCDSYTYILKDSVSSGIMFINTNQLSSKTINTIQPASDNMICLAVAKEGLLNIQKT